METSYEKICKIVGDLYLQARINQEETKEQLVEKDNEISQLKNINEQLQSQIQASIIREQLIN